MPKPAFSGTFRGGSTVGPNAQAAGIASHSDIGTQGDYGTDVFKWSGVTAPSSAGGAHDAMKSLAMVHVQQERIRRAHFLASKAEKESAIAQKRLAKETWETLVFKFEKTQEAIVHGFGWAQGQFHKMFEDDDGASETSSVYGDTKLRGRAAVCEIIAKNAKESAFRAEQEIERARKSRQHAIEAARASRTLPSQDRVRLIDTSNDDRVQKPPSTLKVTISEAKNFPTRKGFKNVNPYAVISFINPNEKNPNEPPEVQTAVTPIKWKSQDPDFLFTYDFFVADDWEDEVRPEAVEIAFFDCASSNILKPVVGDDPLVGTLKFPLREVCKRVQPVRYPDGREEKGHFRSDLSKWCDILDSEDNPVFIELPPDAKPDDEPLPCQALVGIQYLDSAKKPKIVNTIQAVQMPTRKPIPAPAPNPPPSWADHPVFDVIERTESA